MMFSQYLSCQICSAKRWVSCPQGFHPSLGMAAPAVLFSGPSIVMSQADSADKAWSWQWGCHNVKQNPAPLPQTSLFSRPFAGRARVIESENASWRHAKETHWVIKYSWMQILKKSTEILKRKWSLWYNY